MIRIYLNLIIVMFCITNIFSQNAKTDSLLFELEQTVEDTNKVNIFNNLANTYINSNPDSAIDYNERSLKIFELFGDKKVLQ